MKKLLLGLCMCLTLVGCGSKPEYNRSEEMGMIKSVQLEDMLERMENKETFMFVFTMENCSNCKAFKENVLADYIKDHGFEFNEVILDQIEKGKQQAIYDFVEAHPNPKELLPEGYTELDVLTPTFYFVKDGEVEDILIGGNITEKEFDGYIQKYQLDKAD